jgi:hypothetical protein
METFEAGVKCCWSTHKFVADERGMKCLTCEKVMTNQAWEEKGECRLGHTNAVPAIAIYPRSSRNPTPHTRTPRSRLELQWRDPPPPVQRPRARYQLRWRDAKTPFPQKWQIIVISAISGFLVFVIVALLTK